MYLSHIKKSHLRATHAIPINIHKNIIVKKHINIKEKEEHYYNRKNNTPSVSNICSYFIFSIQSPIFFLYHL